MVAVGRVCINKKLNKFIQYLPLLFFCIQIDDKKFAIIFTDSFLHARFLGIDIVT